MITYNPKDWFKLIFQFHKSDTFRILLPNMLLLGVLTGGLVYYEITHNVTFKSSTMFHQILGFVLSMLLVFRINSAYDRWWEGRKQWGSLVNNSRNLMIKLDSVIPETHRKDKIYLKNLIITFVFSLKDHLKDTKEFKDITTFEGFDKGEFDKRSHKPNYMAGLILKHIEKLRREGIISEEKMLFMNSELQSLLDITGACERIKNTPIPFSYSMFLKKIIFIYVITMPIAFSIDFKYWAIPIVMLIFYAFASIELISEEVEDPFGDDANDLPTQEISERIKAGLNEIYPS